MTAHNLFCQAFLLVLIPSDPKVSRLLRFLDFGEDLNCKIILDDSEITLRMNLRNFKTSVSVQPASKCQPYSLQPRNTTGSSSLHLADCRLSSVLTPA